MKEAKKAELVGGPNAGDESQRPPVHLRKKGSYAVVRVDGPTATASVYLWKKPIGPYVFSQTFELEPLLPPNATRDDVNNLVVSLVKKHYPDAEF